MKGRALWYEIPHAGGRTPAHCLRFAHPAEADQRLEVRKPANRYLESSRFRIPGRPEPWNGVERNGNGMESDGVEWNCTQWNEMEWKGVEWNAMERKGTEWSRNGIEWS